MQMPRLNVLWKGEMTAFPAFCKFAGLLVDPKHVSVAKLVCFGVGDTESKGAFKLKERVMLIIA